MSTIWYIVGYLAVGWLLYTFGPEWIRNDRNPWEN